MVLLDNFRGAFRALLSNKLRSALTMLGIIIGVSAVISLLSIGQGVEQFINDQFNALGTNVLFVLPKLSGSQGAQMAAQFANQTTLTTGDARALADPLIVPDTAGTAPQIRVDGLARYGNANLITSVRGVTPSFAEFRNLDVVSGRLLTDEDVQATARVAVIGQTVQTELFPAGTEPLDRYVKINDVPFKVIGVLAERGGNQFSNDDNQILVPLTTARQYLRDIRARNGLPGVGGILMQAVEGASSEALKADSTTVLRDRHNISYRDEDDFQVFSQADLLQTFSSISTAITVFLSAIAGISLLVGGIGVMNIMLVTVTERTREIGLRKAVGARHLDVLFQFLIEALVLSFVGGLAGLVVAFVVTSIVRLVLPDLSPSVTLPSIVLAVSVTTMIGLFFGMYPANRAASLSPIKALRFE